MQEITSKKEIAQRLKVLRKSQNLSQQDLSDILEISRSNYSQIELGKQFPSYPSLVILSRYFNKSYDWLLHGDESQDNLPLMNLNKEEKTTGKPLQTFISLVSQANHKHYIQSCHNEHFLKLLPLIHFPFKEVKEVCRAFEIARTINSLGLKKQDIVLVKRVDKPTRITTNNIYLFITEREIIIDRIYQNIKTKQCFVLQQKEGKVENSLSYQDLKEVWCLIGKYTSEFTILKTQLKQQLDKYDEILTAIRDDISALKNNVK